MDLDEKLEAALALHRAGELAPAIAAYESVLAMAPDHPGAWMNLGAARRQQGDTQAALAALGRADGLAPGHPGILYNLGNAHAEAGQLEAAVDCLMRATEADPGFADAFNNLDEVLHRDGRDEDAVDAWCRGREAAPRHVGLLTNLGNARHRQGRSDEALALLHAASTEAPADIRVLRNLGNVLRTSGQLEEADRVLGQALALAPDDPETRCLYAFTRLARGDFAAGWDAYAWRWQSAEHEAARPFAFPQWAGSDLDGQRLLVWGEQAVGDELMFATMFADLARTGGRITVETEHRLEPLFARSFPDFQVVSRRIPPDPRLSAGGFDWQIASGDLGRFLRRDEAAFRANAPYLVPDAARLRERRAAYDALAAGRRRIGISWRSGAEQAGVARSVGLEDLAPLLNRDDCWFVSLQYGEVAADLDRLEKLSGVRVHSDPAVDPLTDLDGAAAQMAALDLVISAANTTVHMAGALGLPTWVLLSANPDWRWMTGGDGSPWYPTVRHFRQAADGDWTAALDALGRALATFD